MLADHVPHTTKIWDVVIPGEPQAWQRAGVGRNGHFTRTRTARFEHAVAICALAVQLPKGMRGPLLVSIMAVFGRPKRLARRDGARQYKATKPDADNIAKGVLDGLKDHFHDAEVSDLHVHKRWAAVGERPHTHVEIRQLREE